MSSEWVVKAEQNLVGHQVVTVTKLSPEEVTDESTPAQSFTVTTSLVDGVAYSLFCPKERWSKLNMLTQYRAGDIIVATFPKCGTTWIEQCILLLLADGYKEGLNPATKNVYVPGSTAPGKVWLEAALQQDPSLQHKMGLEAAPLSVQNFMEMPGSRVIKTHAPVQLLLGMACFRLLSADWRQFILKFDSQTIIKSGTDGDGLSALPEGVKVVVMTRNPLDACVSSYYHAWNPFKSGSFTNTDSFVLRNNN
jgi:hypothetical protein